MASDEEEEEYAAGGGPHLCWRRVNGGICITPIGSPTPDYNVLFAHVLPLLQETYGWRHFDGRKMATPQEREAMFDALWDKLSPQQRIEVEKPKERP